MDIPRFHLAFPVRDLGEARAFYGGLLGCPEGRSSDEWVDFDFHGHQIVAHLSPDEVGHKATNPVDGHDVPVRHFGVILAPAEVGPISGRGGATSPVDGHDVPVRHFGAILPPAAWDALAERLKAAGTQFIIAPHIRFPGEPGEQATMFFLDPSGNALEFKSFQDGSRVFAH